MGYGWEFPKIQKKNSGVTGNKESLDLRLPQF